MTIRQHRINARNALKMVSTAVEAETGITYRRLVQAAIRLHGPEGIWQSTDMTSVDYNLCQIMNHSYLDIRQHFSPKLPITDYTKLLNNPLWNKEIYNLGLESSWALIDREVDKKCKK